MIVKIGVLFSQSGPMSVTEQAHIQGVLLACAEINEQAEEDGFTFEPVILNPDGNDQDYARLATELMLEHRVAAIFGCCLSSSRKAVLPVIDRFNGILLYPSVYEGFEFSPNVIYGGAVPNQVVLPLLEYIFKNHGKRIALVGSDTLYAREVNRIVKEFLTESGGSVVCERYFPFDAEIEDFQPVLCMLKESGVDAIISTVVGNDSVVFYESFHSVGIDGRQVPIASLTTTESELAQVSEKARAGHVSVAPYFSSIESAENRMFLKAYRSRFGKDAQPSVYSEICYVQVHMLAKAIRRASDLSTEGILTALSGSVLNSPSGDKYLDPMTQHFSHKPQIGVASESGVFDVVWSGKSPVAPDPYLVSYDRTVSTTSESDA
ncbi:Aliphatic amidase expression-regulating protein [Grimontia celer]|uniref:Aliphatic amidase expression-regulating protein n=1 Tax=Grimontia celer TaxID=1796497 RepID=A0A128EUU1_9GAMM|nr:transporter substrate-binding domain-containing protein [Grimontia celer]CZF78362.1 Aliphatic amidase expression-regulating protein [Grimontia celer]